MTMETNPMVPPSTGIVVVGNGPSSLILSFILEGNIPFYDPFTKFGHHPDHHLHNLLMTYTYHDDNPTPSNSTSFIPLSLLDAVSDKSIINHISSQDSSFSSFVLPINLLLDRLTCSDDMQYASFEFKQTRIKWVNFKSNLSPVDKADYDTNSDIKSEIPYVVLGSNETQGGQWSSKVSNDDPTERSLSYAEMLSLPGYSLTEYYQNRNNSEPEASAFTTFLRPKREDISDYYHQYCQHQGLAKHSFSNIIVISIDKCEMDDNLFTTAYYDIVADRHASIVSKYVVLASGIFEKPPLANLGSMVNEGSIFLNETYYDRLENTINIKKLIEDGQNGYYELNQPLDEFGQPLVDDDQQQPVDLIIGSGLSAAESIAHYFESEDAAISKKKVSSMTPTIVSDTIPDADNSKCIVHVFKWSDDFLSPLRGFSKELYPEYSFVFKLMKRSVKLLAKLKQSCVDSQFFMATVPKLSQHYEAIPNGMPLEIDLNNGTVRIQLSNIANQEEEEGSSSFVIRRIKSVRLCIGRSGSLEYLAPSYIQKLDALSERTSKALSSSVLGSSSTCTSIKQSPSIVTKNTLKPIILAGNESFFFNGKRRNSATTGFSTSLTNLDNFAETASSVSAHHPLRTPPNTRSESSHNGISSNNNYNSGGSSPTATTMATTSTTTTMTTKENITLSSSDEDNTFSTNLEILPRMFVIGSLTGDTLVRFLLGGCVYVSSKIFEYEGKKVKRESTMGE